MNNKFLTFCIDVGVAAGLCGALFLVLGVDGLLTAFTPKAGQDTPEVVLVPKVKKIKAEPKPLRLAVTRPYREKGGELWDEVEKVLVLLGKGYDKYNLIDEMDLRNLEKLKTYDVVFCSCRDVKNASVVDETAKVVRAYVEQGGALYAADWRYNLVSKAFPEMRPAPEVMPPGEGYPMPDGVMTPPGHVDVDVVDDGLRPALGKFKLHLNFDLRDWKPAAFGADDVRVLLRGSYNDRSFFQPHTSALLVKFAVKKGTVFFTSFHNGKETSEDEKKLLKYLVLSLVTASVETNVEEVSASSQFKKTDSNIFGASKDALSTKGVYENQQAGPLRFRVVFPNAGAELKLEVISPGGESFVEQDTASFTIRVPTAAAGKWHYTITVIGDLPYDNFPFDVQVSAGKK